MRKEVYDPKAFIPHAASLHQAFAHCARFPAAASRRSGGRISVPLWPYKLSLRLPVLGSVGRYPADYLIGREPLPERRRVTPLLSSTASKLPGVRGISPPFDGLFRSPGQVTRVLLSRLPLRSTLAGRTPLDLHALSAPPAFVLSQDQTLRKLTYLPSTIQLLRRGLSGPRGDRRRKMSMTPRASSVNGYPGPTVRGRQLAVRDTPAAHPSHRGHPPRPCRPVVQSSPDSLSKRATRRPAPFAGALTGE